MTVTLQLNPVSNTATFTGFTASLIGAVPTTTYNGLVDRVDSLEFNLTQDEVTIGSLSNTVATLSSTLSSLNPSSVGLSSIAQNSSNDILLNASTFVDGQLTAYAKLETRLSEHGLNIQPWSESGIQSARFDIWTTDDSNNFELSFFRDSYSSSYAWLSVYVPDNSGNVNCSIGANGNSHFSAYAGNVGIGHKTPTDKLHVKNGWAKFEGGIKLTSTGYSMNYGSAAPTSGTYKRGDIVFNSSPSAGGSIGWVCVSAGTPGTWKTWGVISA